MKILITTEWYKPVINGVVNSIISLQNELQGMGHEVRILTLSNNRHSYKEGNVTYIRAIRAGRIYPDARVTLFIKNRLVDEIIKWNPDLIHSQCEFSTFLIACRIARKLDIPIVHTYHTVYENYTHYFFPNRRVGKAITVLLTKGVIKRTDYVIAPTDKVKNMLRGYGVNRNITVVPTGIDLHRFDPARDEAGLRQLRERIGIPDGNKVVITVGRLAKEKNLEEIILYFSRLKNPGVTLLIVGDGPHRINLEQYAREIKIADQVIFTGMIAPEEVSDYYKLGDVFVSASSSEAQGLTYMEALAVGVPALCKKDPCLEHVIIDGINGWQYTSYEHFADRVNTILYQDDLRKNLSENAHAWVVKEYSSTAFAMKVSQIYEQSLCL